MAKRHSEACERNQGPFSMSCGAGLPTGGGCWRSARERAARGALRRAPAASHWQTGDLARHHPGILAWLAEARLANWRRPLALDANAPACPRSSAMRDSPQHAAHHVCRRWRGSSATSTAAAAGGVLAVYGPFNYGGRYTAHSNAPSMPICSCRTRPWASRLRAVDALARGLGLELAEDCAMPATTARWSGGAPVLV